MNKTLDLIIAVQVTTGFAFAATICAHLIDNYANPNWQFSVYVMLGIAVMMMLAPYWLFLNQENKDGA